MDKLVPEINVTEAERRQGGLTPETLAQAVKLFRSAGCLQLDGIFPPEFIAMLRATCLERYAGYLADREFPDALSVGNKRVMVTVALTPPFRDPSLYANSLLYPIIKDLLEPSCLLNSFGCVLALPGAEAQHIHQDGGRLFNLNFNLERLLPCYALTVIVPLVELNESNGTTRLYPGSHRSNDKEQALALPYQDPIVPLGGCLLMDYRLYHNGTPTLAAQPRPILYLTYSRPWYRDPANFGKQSPLQIDAERCKEVSPEFQHLFLGHRSCSSRL